MHVAKRADPIEAGARLHAAYQRAIPYEAGDDEPDLAVRTGPVVERVLHEANRHGVERLVTGTRALGPIARFMLGSVSQGVLRDARVPVLLVPPRDLDIVFLGPARGSIMCGPVIAALDLAKINGHQLQMAGRLARIAGERLILLTVTEEDADDGETRIQLHDRSRGLEPVQATALIVRRGDVAEQIAQCAHAERSGLIVMGLRDAARGRPGATAARVLRAGNAFVLAVPDSAAEPDVDEKADDRVTRSRARRTTA